MKIVAAFMKVFYAAAKRPNAAAGCAHRFEEQARKRRAETPRERARLNRAGAAKTAL